jgi:hypothetical protein
LWLFDATEPVGHAFDMLIVCSGLDSYRSLERVKFLEAAYREKYDPAGSSIDHLSYGKDAIDPLLSLCVSGSLFSSRRFIRADGIISSCPKAKRDALIKALAHDSEYTIIVCREEGVLKDSDLKPFFALSGFKHDQFDPLSPAKFFQWAKEQASAIGYANESVVRSIAEASNGDSWAYIAELYKIFCGGEQAEKMIDEISPYAVIDALCEQRNNRFYFRSEADDDEAVIALVSQQARALLFIQHGKTEGIHPFVVQKSRRLSCPNPTDFFERMLSSFVWSRSGFANAEESLDLLG